MSNLKYKLESEEKIQHIDERALKQRTLLEKSEQIIIKGCINKKTKRRRKLLKEQQIVLKDYFEFLTSNSRIKSSQSIFNLINVIFYLGITIRKSFSSITKKNLIKYFSNLNKKEYSSASISTYQRYIKQFFNWLYEDDDKVKRDRKGELLLISWIKSVKTQKKLKDSELITIDEIKKLCSSATNDRDRLIPIMLYETGARKGEFINIKIGDCNIDSNKILNIDLDGKTGKRSVWCIDSIPYFKVLLENHPFKNDPRAPLFIDHDQRFKGRQLGEVGLNLILNTLVGFTDIQKNIYPHLFRHSRATELSQFLTEPEMRIFFGWSATSNMPTRYCHLNRKSVKDKMLRLRGILPQEDLKVDNKLQSKICWNCKTINGVTRVFCYKCQSPLNVTKYKEELKTKEEIDSYFYKFLQSEMGNEFKQKFREFLIKERKVN